MIRVNAKIPGTHIAIHTTDRTRYIPRESFHFHADLVALIAYQYQGIQVNLFPLLSYSRVISFFFRTIFWWDFLSCRRGTHSVSNLVPSIPSSLVGFSTLLILSHFLDLSLFLSRSLHKRNVHWVRNSKEKSTRKARGRHYFLERTKKMYSWCNKERKKVWFHQNHDESSAFVSIHDYRMTREQERTVIHSLFFPTSSSSLCGLTWRGE